MKVISNTSFPSQIIITECKAYVHATPMIASKKDEE